MRDVDREFRESVELLHEQALSVIANNQTTWFDDISGAYRSSLAMFPVVWSEYGQVFSDDIEQGGRFFEEGPIDVLYRALYTELVAALRSSNEEIASDAVGRLYGIASDALQIGASAVLDRTLRFLLAAYELGFDIGTDVSKAAGEHAVALLTQFGQLRLARELTDPSDIEMQRAAKPLVYRYFRVIGELLKLMVDRVDSESFVDLDHAWGEMLEFWNPEHDSPQDYELPLMERQLGSEHPDVVSARLGAALNRERAEMKASLVEARTSYRFMLLSWVLRVLHREGGSEGLLEIMKRLRERFPNVGAVQNAATLSLSQEWYGTRSPLSDWLFAEMRPRGAVHSLAPEQPVFRTFVLVSISHLTRDASQALKPTDWIRLWRDELKQVAAGISKEDPEWSGLPLESSFDEARSKFLGLLDEAAAEQAEAEAQQLREAEPSQTLLEEFKEQTAEAWAEGRMLPDLFKAAGMESKVERVDDPPPGRSISDWIPKDFFVEPVRLGGMESSASMFGRQLAHDELQQFLELFQVASTVTTTRAEVSSVLRSLAAPSEHDEPAEEDVETHLEPSLILLPYDWALLQMLDLSPHQGAEPPAGVSPEGSRYFVGYWERIPAFWLHELENEIVVADLEQFLQWKRFALGAESSELAVRLEVFREEEARELAARQIERAHGDESEVNERTNRIREQVFVQARMSYQLKILNSAAARRVVVAD